MGNGITTSTSDPERFVKVIKRGLPGVELKKEKDVSTYTFQGRHWLLFVEELASNETLGRLHFTGIQLNITDLCTSLSTNYHLRTLVLSGNDIRSGKEIGEMLKSNQTLRILKIIVNKLGDDACGAIAEGIEMNRTLHELDLSQNAIGDIGAAKLAKALEVNNRLRFLHLLTNYVGAKGSQNFEDCLKHNHCLQQLTLDWENIPTTTGKRIKQRTRENREAFKAAVLAARKQQQDAQRSGARGVLKPKAVKAEKRPAYAALGAGSAEKGMTESFLARAIPKPHRDQFPFISTLPDLPKPFQYYFFPSHNWGKEQVIHDRVKQLVDAFESHGRPAWFDVERLTGNIPAQITDGVDQSLIFFAFITRDYVEKVVAGAKSNVTDWCQYEFNYAETRFPGRIYPVVLDVEMLSSNNWVGPVGARLGNKMFIDFTSDDKLKSCLLEMCKIVQQEHVSMMEHYKKLEEEALQRKLELERRELEERKRREEEEFKRKKEQEKRNLEERKNAEQARKHAESERKEAEKRELDDRKQAEQARNKAELARKQAELDRNKAEFAKKKEEVANTLARKQKEAPLLN